MCIEREPCSKYLQSVIIKEKLNVRLKSNMNDITNVGLMLAFFSFIILLMSLVAPVTLAYINGKNSKKLKEIEQDYEQKILRKKSYEKFLIHYTFAINKCDANNFSNLKDSFFKIYHYIYNDDKLKNAVKALNETLSEEQPEKLNQGTYDTILEELMYKIHKLSMLSIDKNTEEKRLRKKIKKTLIKETYS